MHISTPARVGFGRMFCQSELDTSWSPNALFRMPMPPPTAPHMMTEVSILSVKDRVPRGSPQMGLPPNPTLTYPDTLIQEVTSMNRRNPAQLKAVCEEASPAEACKEKDQRRHSRRHSCLFHPRNMMGWKWAFLHESGSPRIPNCRFLEVELGTVFGPRDL